MDDPALLGRIAIRSAADVLDARRRIRSATARLGFDDFDQVQLAAGISELSRELVTAGGGELEISVATSRPRRLVVRAKAAAGSRDVLPAGVAAARRLIGRAPEEEDAATGWTFSRLIRRPLSGASVAEAGSILSSGSEDPYGELERQDSELVRVLEELKARQSDVDSLNRELEETNRGVLALYAELDEKAESLKRANAERSRFLSNVTHELRTPLSSIIALCRLLLSQSAQELDDDQRKQVAYIEKSAQDLHEFVSDLLDLAKVDAGKVTVTTASFELRDVLVALRGMFRPLFADTDVALDIELPRLVAMESDEGKVTQILRNLVSNAFKFTESGEVRVTAEHHADPDEVLIRVADTGIGIPAEQLGQIFEEFVQVDSAQPRRPRGTGLGLPLSRNLARILGGDLEVESEVGRGSTFTLRLPRIYPRPGANAARKAGHVLVADDDHISRYVAREHLERMGWNVIEAADGEMALKLAREGDCRAIVLDLLMPGMSGFEVLDRLGADPKTAAIPVVVRTSLPLDEIEPAAVARAAAVFSKHDDTLQAVVDRIASSTGDDR